MLKGFKIAYYLVLIALVFQLFSCNNNSVSDNSTIEIIPLKAGNIWIILNTDLSSKKVDTFKMKCLRDTILKGSKWTFTKYNYISDSSWKNTNGISHDMQLNRIGADGFYQYMGLDTLPEFLVFKYPCKVGDTYKLMREVQVVKNIDTTISFNDVTYKNVIYYEGTETTDFGTYSYLNKRFVKPGIGIIKMEFYLIDKKTKSMTLDSKRELLSYSFN